MDDKLKQYLSDFEADRLANDDVRDMCNEEMRFSLVAGAQWEDWDIKGYDNRPKMEVDQVSPYLMRTYAKYCDGRVQPDFQPSDGAGETIAEIMDGLYRRDIQRRGGQDAIDTAVFEQMSCGFGAVLFGEEYEDDGDLENERQNITITELNNAYSSVYFDAASKRADKSDAGHVTLLTMYSNDKFKDRWPKFDPSGLTTNDRKFFNFNAGANMCYVATRYEVKEKRTPYYFYFNPMKDDTVRLEEKDREQDEKILLSRGYQFTRRRVVKEKRVYKTVFTGKDILEKERKIAGKYLPVVPCYGFRMFIDAVEHFHGLVRKKMDSQRIFNMVSSLAAESAARSHPAIPIFTNDQMASESSQQLWQMDKSKLSFLTVDPQLDGNGNVISTGPIGYHTSEGLTQSGALLVQMTNELLRQQVGGAPQDISDPNASGKAINSLISMSDQDTRIVFDNINKFMRRCGEVYLSKAQEVYGGRENAERTIRLVTDQNKTKPVALLSQTGGAGGVDTINDLSKGKFEVVTSVGKTYQTRQEETFEQLKEILSITPPQSPLFNTIASQLIQTMPNAGLSDIKEYLRNQQLLEGTAKPEGEEEERFMAEQQANQSNQPPDANTQYLMTEAEKNKAQIGEIQADTGLKLAKTEETRVQAAVKAAELRGNLPR